MRRVITIPFCKSGNWDTKVKKLTKDFISKKWWSLDLNLGSLANLYHSLPIYKSK